jgi:hypothetical protein
MLVIKIYGGLGNQIFQYACAAQIKKQYPWIEIHFDLSYYRNKEIKYPRTFLLNDFLAYPLNELNAGLNTKPNSISRVYKFLIRKKWIRKTRNFIDKWMYHLNIKYGNIINENFELGYIGNLLYRRLGKKKNSGDILLDGYWCDYRYFELGLEDLRKNFKLQNPGNKFIKLSGMISENDTMLHIRRGDYLQIGKGADGIFLGIDYYRKALDQLEKSGINPEEHTVWVFSDDIPWCQQNLPIEFPKWKFSFDSKELSDVECFELMRRFAVRIIANSTYSLWSLYLANNQPVRTIYPEDWENSYKKSGFEVLNPVFRNR